MAGIYLDHQATTPLDLTVFERMVPYLTTRYGNASSLHSFGAEAKEAVAVARSQVAGLINAGESEIVFTSGATESDNLAIKGVKAGHIVTVRTEHKAVLDSCAARGNVTVLGVERDGLIDLDALKKAITDKTVLVSVMAANNEIGVLQDLEAIGEICRKRKVLFHTDAAQAAGKIPLDVEEMNIDLLSMSGHKMYGPKGVGALYIRKRTKIEPQMHGGGHQAGLRSGTLNVPGIVGMGAAAELGFEGEEVAELRDRLWKGITDGLDLVHLNGHATKRLPGNLNVSFEFVEGGRLLEEIEELAVSSGAACTTAMPEPSHVLKALGVPEPLIASSIRFGLGRETTAGEIDRAIEIVVGAVTRLRAESPLYRNARGKEV